MARDFVLAQPQSKEEIACFTREYRSLVLTKLEEECDVAALSEKTETLEKVVSKLAILTSVSGRVRCLHCRFR